MKRSSSPAAARPTPTAITLALALGLAGSAAAAPADAALPRHLSDTGLFVAGSVSEVRPGVLPYSPQYTLWSDGADKRRWLYLPPGSAIDASRPDAWQFPRGTRLWKEFSHAGRPVETRYIERRSDGSWRYATYVWNAQGSDAELAPVAGIGELPVKDAPNGRYAIPSESDCRACHEGAAVPVLGVGTLQLSPDRDPQAVHASPPAAANIDLRALVARGSLRRLPARLLEQPPRIAAASPTERATLGYLHANCGHCHNDNGEPAPVSLVLAQTVTASAASTQGVLRSVLDAPSRFRPPGSAAAAGGALLIAPGRAQASVLVMRMRSRHPQVQMPPLGTHLPDAEGIALVESWIDRLLPNRKEIAP